MAVGFCGVVIHYLFKFLEGSLSLSKVSEVVKKVKLVLHKESLCGYYFVQHMLGVLSTYIHHGVVPDKGFEFMVAK